MVGTPLSVDLDAEKLPVPYHGDSSLLPRLYDRFIKASKKDEYESKADYANRLGTEIDDKIYAFASEVSVDGFLNTVEYDAEEQVLAVTVAMISLKPLVPMAGMSFGELMESKSYLRIEISSKYKPLNDYIGANAFGHSVRVSHSVFDNQGLAVANEIKTKFLGRTIRIKMQPNEARVLGKNVGMVFICKLHKPRPMEFLAYEDFSHVKPTIDSPSDISSVYHLVMVDLYQIWIYDKGTGRILAKDIVI